MSKLDMEIIDETEKLNEKQKELVSRLLTFAALKLDVGEAECSVTFVGNERIQEINREYRDKDQPTDVISFALEEVGEEEVEIVAPNMPRVLGDIVISVSKAEEQAEDYGHSLDRELGFLSVHGLLHLLGYDHMTAEDEKVMFGMQEEILQEFGLNRD